MPARTAPQKATPQKKRKPGKLSAAYYVIICYRSAVTGRFVSAAYARKHPRKTVKHEYYVPLRPDDEGCTR